MRGPLDTVTTTDLLVQSRSEEEEVAEEVENTGCLLRIEAGTQGWTRS